MENSKDQANALPLEAAMRFAKSESGKQLLAMLQQTQGEKLEAIMAQAAAGNYNAAKESLAQILQDPKAKSLLDQIGG